MTVDEIREQAASLLDQLNPFDPLGTRLFNAVARHSVSVSVEAVCLRRTGRGVGVFLSLRGEEESFPEEWHCPGSIQRPGETEEQVLQRIQRKELRVPIVSALKADEWDNPGEGARGHTRHLIYIVSLNRGDEVATGMWFLVSNLPPDTIHYHRNEVIPRAVRAFLA
ncbi:MAG: hypothetical protein HYV34_02840 [Candidatus Kerfeldbacteria bacterium]|nr:hypothetical protein [Candidatus Kerfeldbacteria bacterium]